MFCSVTVYKLVNWFSTCERLLRGSRADYETKITWHFKTNCPVLSWFPKNHL